MNQAIGLVELRNKIDAVYLRMMSKSDGSSIHNNEILLEISANLDVDLEKNKDALMEMALIKLINDVSRRRGRPSDQNGDLDLFDEVSGIPHSLSVGRGMKAYTADMTLGTAKLWLSKHPPKPAKDPYANFRQLVEELEEDGAADEDTLHSILVAKNSTH